MGVNLERRLRVFEEVVNERFKRYAENDYMYEGEILLLNVVAMMEKRSYSKLVVFWYHTTKVDVPCKITWCACPVRISLR